MIQDAGKRRFHRKAPVLLTEINITPFVDVMLVLLVIFMVTTPLLLSGVEVNLPKEQADALEVKEENVVTLRKDGSIFFNDKRITEQKLFDALRSTAALKKKSAQVFLRADEAIPYGRVVHAMGIIKGAGIARLGMITQTPQKSLSGKKKTTVK